jgi:hypothetical protein
MKRNAKPVHDQTPREPLPPPAKNSDIRPWISIGEAAQLALSKIEHDMASIDAPKAEAIQVRDSLKAARDLIDDAINVIELWVDRPRGGGATPASTQTTPGDR